MIPTTWIWVLFFSLVSGTRPWCPFFFQPDTCKMFGSGIIQTFNASSFHVRTNCPFTLTHFTHDQVDYDITTLRGDDGLLSQMEIIVNKIRTVVQIGGILVEKKSVSLPYDHTYQHIFQYGTYTRLRSLLFPLSVTWHTLPAGIDTVMVRLLQKHIHTDKNIFTKNLEQLITSSMIPDDFCQIRDNVFAVNHLCNKFFSHTMDCLQDRNPHFLRLCEENMYSYESSNYVRCSFFSEVVQQCRHNSYIWIIWRTLTGCAAPTCPGDLVYEEQGAAFVPSCSNFNPSHSRQNLIRSCVCPEGSVLNDQTDGFHCVNISKCPCKFAGRSYVSGDKRSTNCQTCVCQAGGWHCSENSCPPRCLLEGQFVTTFDGKQYAVPGKCAYVASQGLNWTIMVRFSEKYSSLHTAVLQLPQVLDHALVFWQSSMFVQVQTSFGMKIQVQMSPEIQLYITLPRNNPYNVSGLCGNSNNDTTDDFTTSTGIVENSPQPFALSWSVGTCAANIPPICSNFHVAFEYFFNKTPMCSVLRDQTGIFAKCHDHIPADQFYTTCVGRTCNCGSHLQQCLCVALGSYAKACAILGVAVGDWRKATNCTLTCANNQQFFYDTRTCNHTCRSLSGPDPRCWSGDAPVEGCGCPEGTHLNQGGVCTPKSECECHYSGGAIQPGPVVIDGLQCLCENGELHCSKDCGCRNGKVCYHCSERPVNTAQKTCDSLGKLQAVAVTCESGCYCPHDQYEDHRGNCVSMDNCTCVYSGKVFAPGQHVKTNCKTCTCGQGRWHCTDEPCPGQCQVYGNGHYQTFDSKWYRFNGHCQYTLVEDHCGNENGSFSVSVESVPCCDEEMTCSRSIVLDIYGTVTLTLSDQRVTRRLQTNTTSPMDLLYATRTVGLYIIVSVPSKGITLIWDKHTRITVELQPNWRSRVCGLCGNFDSSAMNDLRTSGSAVLSSPMVFGNSWKAATPPCSDVTTEMFPCKRNSYCAAWAQRRCMIITSDTFKDCHLKVDPEPYYQACVQESCSCEFEGKFLGFCTAVAAYAEACSDQGVCVNWRTPAQCPVYCDYYNQQGQCTWHYQACGEVLTCGKDDYFTHKLEGCYPRCPEDSPYYDENTGECTTLVQCTCSFNATSTAPTSATATVVTSTVTWSETTPNSPSLTTGTTGLSTSAATLPPSTTSGTEPPTSVGQTTALQPSTSTAAAPESTTVKVVTAGPHTPKHHSTTHSCEECRDLKRKKTWACNEVWTEDCFNKTCVGGKIELTPVVCPEPTVPTCPRDRVTKVSDGCCETWKCDCRCDLYGDPHYITFEGVAFDFLDECTYILVEERSPQHHLSISVDNFFCMPGSASCAKGISLRYQSHVATLSIIQPFRTVQVALDGKIIQPPYEEHGLRFETTGYVVSVHLPDVRSYVSLSPSYTLVVNLAMEHFFNNTQGQCGVCGGPSCVRREGQIEDNSCCDKTAYDWVVADPLKPACSSAPRNVSCHPTTPTDGPFTRTTTCPSNPVCELLEHPVFSECREKVNLQLKKRNCQTDSCGNRAVPCSALEQAAEECKNAGVCVDWRTLTDGRCDVACSTGLVYRECSDKLDDFCYGGQQHPGSSLDKASSGCFCPSGQIRAGKYSVNCVSNCSYCKGPMGEPRLPGEVWKSNCLLCTCNSQTLTEQCFPKPSPPAPLCSPGSVPVNVSCCGDQACGERRNFLVCLFFNLSSMQISLTFFTLLVHDDRVAVLHGDLQVVQSNRCCQERSSVKRSVTLQCSDHTSRLFTYEHITSCECRTCGILR
uniref:Mucin-19-like n=1 Tax=Cynoglossus semilaevis TaxID=244447 RepID=A0A3P8WB74_CYNSE